MARRLAIVGNQAFAMRNFRGALIAALVARGIEVFALAPDYDNTDRTAIRALGAVPVDYPLRRASISPLHDLIALGNLSRQLHRIKPDVVLSFSAKPTVFGTLAATIAGVPRRFALIEGLGHAFMENRTLRATLLRLVVRYLYRLSLTRSTKVFFLNDDDRGEFIRGDLVAETKARTIGAIGVDLDDWRPPARAADGTAFLFVGRLLREKGIFEFIDAARRVKVRFPETRFVVLGATDANPSSIQRQEAEGWVTEGLIEWPGHVEVKPWMGRTNVFVLPSYREGVPRSTQEAMAMGMPIVTTDVPGCRDTVLDGVNGFLVPARDTDALAGAMIKLAESPSLILRMGAASRRMAEERFDIHTATARLISAMGF